NIFSPGHLFPVLRFRGHIRWNKRRRILTTTLTVNHVKTVLRFKLAKTVALYPMHTATSKPTWNISQNPCPCVSAAIAAAPPKQLETMMPAQAYIKYCSLKSEYIFL